MSNLKNLSFCTYSVALKYLREIRFIDNEVQSDDGGLRMSELIISEQHRQAVELHQKIMISANLAQQNLFEMCTGLKTMRDNKLYKELGYSNFEDRL